MPKHFLTPSPLLVAAALGLMQLRTRALLSRQQQLELRVQQRTEELLHTLADAIDARQCRFRGKPKGRRHQTL